MLSAQYNFSVWPQLSPLLTFCNNHKVLECFPCVLAHEWHKMACMHAFCAYMHAFCAYMPENRHVHAGVMCFVTLPPAKHIDVGQKKHR